MKKTNTFKITIMAFAVVINIIGAFIAILLKLPIFIDTIGTFLSAFLFGTVGGVLTCIVTSLINGLTFDPYSLYFFPVQLVIGLTAGICYKKNLFNGKFIIFGIIITTIIGSLLSSLISAFVFGVCRYFCCLGLLGGLFVVLSLFEICLRYFTMMP